MTYEHKRNLHIYSIINQSPNNHSSNLLVCRLKMPEVPIPVSPTIQFLNLKHGRTRQNPPKIGNRSSVCMPLWHQQVQNVHVLSSVLCLLCDHIMPFQGRRAYHTSHDRDVMIMRLLLSYFFLTSSEFIYTFVWCFPTPESSWVDPGLFSLPPPQLSRVILALGVAPPLIAIAI